jgi:hypothetical protein
VTSPAGLPARLGGDSSCAGCLASGTTETDGWVEASAWREVVMRSKLGLLIVGLGLISTPPAPASEAPLAVSPGGATGASIGETCPTFSWGAVPGAKSYELVVYRLGEEYEKEEPVIQQTLPGSASSWTPSLDACLTRGGKFAWSLRVVGEQATSGWSTPSLFEVSAGPSVADLEEALDVVNRYLAGKHGTAYATPAGTEAGKQMSASRLPAPAAPRAAPASPSPTVMSAEGNVHATSFTGDGSNLAGVALLDDLCALARQVSSSLLPAGCPGKTVFITSLEYQGDRGGRAGGDAKCAERAAAAGLPGSYKAWLSDHTCAPADACRSFTKNAGPYYRVDGVRIADDWDDLTDGELAQPINIDEQGAQVTITQNAWTNTKPDGHLGQTSASLTCSEWTTSSSGNGLGGRSHETDTDWTVGIALNCGGTSTHLYCFQQ